MKIKNLALSFAIAASACTLQAQQSMPDMPGMKMDPPPPKPQQAPAPKPNRRKNVPDPMPGDMKSMSQDAGDAKAKAAADSVTQSFQQQAHQPQGKPGPASDASSTKLPIQELQEPEAIDFRTGSDLPAPELLRDVVSREPMTVENFLALADKTNPTLSQAQRNVDRSRQQARQMGLPPNPIVGYSGDHIRGGEYHGGEEGAFFSQEFILGRKLALRRDIYRAEGRSNEYAVEIQKARIHNDVARAFFDALAAQQSVVVHDRLLKVALDAQTNAHELERVGQADSSEVLNAEIAAEQAKVEFVNAQRMFLATFTQLATYSGQSSLAPQPLTGSLVEPPELDPEGMVVTDTQESPAVKQAEANVAVAEARVKSAQRERVPNLNLKAGEWYSGETLGSTNIKAGWMSFAEAGVQLPLWNRNQGNIQAAKVELDRAHHDVNRTQLLTRNRAEPYAQQYQTARFTAERYRTEMLPRARRAYQLEVTKYQQMAQGYPHVLAAQHMLFTLQLTYIQALNEEWRAAIALQNYTLMNGLDEPMSIGQDSTTMNLPTAPGPDQ
ncbi:TolC family protein [Acidipila sp. EB88]|uniref:TolC family protein n=1 Tax=Acidipila sp. EB88 TaxID=2305226 RepID=UPI000F5DA315|nr:TolC family protein [Acidipila sp. EB88]RRA50408.1 TolC family protein [Acidipila sp. EB88]